MNGIEISDVYLCVTRTSNSKKKCFSIALRHILVVLEMH